MHTDFLPREELPSLQEAVAPPWAALRSGIALSDFTHSHLKPYYQSCWQRIKAQFLEEKNVKDTLRSHAQLMDEVITECWTHIAHEHAQLPAVSKAAILATGGYGRRQLFPYSDVDLLILTGKQQQQEMEAPIQQLLYVLWDLGLKVGHAVRDLGESMAQAKQDASIASSVLDARSICGNTRLAKRFMAELESNLVGTYIPQYVQAKLEEREQRHQNHGDSRFTLEPHVKEGKGGLRDLHTLHWLARYVYGVRNVRELSDINVLTKKEARAYSDAENFLSTIRCWLHYRAERGEERLSFDHQKALAEWEGVSARDTNRAVEKAMRRYFKTTKQVGDLTRIFCAVLEQRYMPPVIQRQPLLPLAQQKRFQVEGKRLNFAPHLDIQEEPEAILEFFQTAQWLSLDLHPEALQRISRNLKHIQPIGDGTAYMRECFCMILKHPGNLTITLQRLNENGVLARLIPEFAALVGQMQYDMYHSFTVDEHVLRAIGVIEALEHDQLHEDLPLSSSLIHTIDARLVLIMAVLLHDIAKGSGTKYEDHGARLAAEIAARFGFSEADCETIAWLVEHHLLFTETAYKRDLQDDATIMEFAKHIQSLERLRLLLLVTIADIRAVGPKIWNAWKGSLLRELYERTEQALRTGIIRHDTQQLEVRKQTVRKALAHWTDEAWDAYDQSVDERFWLSCDEAQHCRIAQLIEARRDAGEPLAIYYESQPENAITELTLCTPNRNGLIADISGALATIGANITMARVFITQENEAILLLHVQNQTAEAYSDDRLLGTLGERMQEIWDKEWSPLQELKERPQYAKSSDVFDVRTEVLIDNALSESHTVIEITARDKPALLAHLTHAIDSQGLQISAAHINTYGEKAVDVFYIKDRYGFKLIHWDAIEKLKAAVKETI